MKITNPIGKKGEEIAVQFLKKKGYKILEVNFHKQYGEIDIIAIAPSYPLLGRGEGSRGTLVFIEVKTRTSNQFGTPFESITPWKLKSLIKTAQLYKASRP